jgi:hypothetical protein
MVKKMALIPIEMLEQLRSSRPSSLTTLTNPVKDQAVKGMAEMRALLQDNSIPDDVKVTRYNEALSNYSTFGDKLLGKSPSPTPAPSALPESATPLFEHMPRTLRPPANALMGELEKHPERITWDRQSREVSINGHLLRGSNIVDLITSVVRSRKNAKIPLHANEFLETLAQLKVPEEYIKNKHRIDKFKALKGDEELIQLREPRDNVSFKKKKKKKTKPLLDYSKLGGIQKRRITTKKSSLYKWKPTV